MLSHLDIDNMDVSDEEKARILEIRKREEKHQFYEVCNEAFDKLSVNWNGDVTLCCTDYDNFMLVGSVMDESLDEIFTGEKARRYRNLIVNEQHRGIRCCGICYKVIE